MEGGANSVIKQCVVLNGQVINIGPWDYKVEPVQIGTQTVQVGVETIEIEPAEYDEEGNLIKEGVFEERPIYEEQPIYEDQATNPLPDGAEVVELDVEYSEEYGWRVVGSPIPETPAEKLARLEQENADLRQAVAELTLLMSLNAGSGSE
jgi:hypothetical protein